ncbi:MAG: amidase [Acidobacteriia bacterium]|nr:amidase [Terriglobia bacterium]
MTPTSSPSAEITSLSATEIARLVSSGALSAREVVDEHIRRIEAVNPSLNAVVVPLFQSARTEAAALDSARARGGLTGPLCGVPMTVKEAFEVTGTPSTMGLTERAAHCASADGILVARLRQAGAILLGKTNVPLLMKGNETSNPLYGRCNNPWNLERTPGGSSGGEAAILAARGSALGLGSDYGGSLRLPAHACGIHALKPTSGRLTMRGYARFRFGQEAILPQPGPMARSVEDLILAMRILGAPGQEAVDESIPPVALGDPAAVDLKRLRVGFYTDNGIMMPAPALRRAVLDAASALEQRGARVELWQPPDAAEAWEIQLRLICADGMASYRNAMGKSQWNATLRRSLRTAALPKLVRDTLRVSLELAGQHHYAERLRRRGEISVPEFFQLVEQRSNYRRRFLSSLDAGQFDALLCPPDALPAGLHGKSFLVGDGQSYAGLYNLLGLPAGVVTATRVRPEEESDRQPTRDLAQRTAREIEKGSAGLPVGIQVVARHWREEIVLALMAALEDHFRRLPEYPVRPPI